MSIPPHASGQNPREDACTMRSYLSADHSHGRSGSHPDPGFTVDHRAVAQATAWRIHTSETQQGR